MYVYRNIKHSSRNHCCHGKALLLNYHECLSVSLLQLTVKKNASFLRRNKLPSVACLCPIFFPYLINGTIFGKYVSENKIFYFLYYFNLKYLILGRTKRDITVNVHRSSCKVPVILVRF
jgi:hypothetical protein